MANVLVIGDLDSVIGFRALGMEVTAVADGAEARLALQKAMVEEKAVVFLTEPLAAHVADLLADAAEKMLPAIILIPSSLEATSVGLDKLRNSVRRATGMDILKQHLASYQTNDE